MKSLDDASWQSKLAPEKTKFPEFGPLWNGSPSQPPPLPPPPSQPHSQDLGDKVNELGTWAIYENQYQPVNMAYLTSMDNLM